MAAVGFHDVCKTFDGSTPVVALDHLSIDIAAGEFFSIVGPSGCGKTTALRILAGLEEPTSGAVTIGGHDVTRLPSRQRNVGLVTQQNALLPERSAYGNIRFPLEVRRRDRRPGPVDDLVSAQAELLGIGHLLDRRPGDLSEGEQRAVQLARSLVAEPTALLLDEPLAFIDSLARQQLRADIVRMQQVLGLTTVLVTADQEDALAVSDRMAVLVDGHLHQVGTPEEVYRAPLTASVAAFVGEPAMNLVQARLEHDTGERAVRLFGHRIPVWSPLLDPYVGRSVLVGVRPEDLDARGEVVPWQVDAVVRTAASSAGRTTTIVETEQGEALRVSRTGPPPRPGSATVIGLRPERFHWFDPATGLAILHPTAA
ncbi:MAG: ABC transporter ATP-binding protein [Acidimicrobiales bacterium]